MNGTILSALGESDAAAFAIIMQEQGAKDAIIGEMGTYSKKEAEEFIKSSALKIPYERHYAIRHDGVLIGVCAIYNADFLAHSAEIGYIIGFRYRRRGFAKFAISMLIKILAGEGFKLAIAHSKKENKYSNKALLACGFEERLDEDGTMAFQRRLTEHDGIYNLTIQG